MTITERPVEGWSVASTDGASVALDLTLDDNLRSLGLVREVIRTLQEARKAAGFDITDRIEVSYATDDAAASAAIAEHAATIADEVLAVRFAEAPVAEATSVMGEPEISFELRAAGT